MALAAGWKTASLCQEILKTSDKGVTSKSGDGFDGEGTTLSDIQDEVCFSWSTIIVSKCLMLGSYAAGGCNHIREGVTEEGRVIQIPEHVS